MIFLRAAFLRRHKSGILKYKGYDLNRESRKVSVRGKANGVGSDEIPFRTLVLSKNKEDYLEVVKKSKFLVRISSVKSFQVLSYLLNKHPLHFMTYCIFAT